MTTPDPFDVGALLSAAISASGLPPAEVARRAGVTAPHMYRLLKDPNCRPPTARRILAALAHHVEAVPDKRLRKATPC